MKRFWYIIRQTAYTVFSFAFFLVDVVYLTLVGFFLITIGGATEEHKRQYHIILQRNAWFIINRVPGTEFAYSNPEGETFQTPSIIISNHQSHLDLMAIMMLTPNLIILTKDWVWHNPFYGIIIRYADFFPVTETDQMMLNIEKKIKEGYSVVIFPEGTRSEDCRIQLFHRGAFYLAEKLHLDIVPVFIKGFGEVLPKKSFHLHPGHMSIEVMPRIYRDALPEECNYRELSRRVRHDYLRKNQEEVRFFRRNG